MLNVFSDSSKKVSEQIRAIQQCAGSSLIRDLVAGPEEEPLYMLKPEITPWLIWINNCILFQLPRVKTHSNAQWIGVRIRIATNMLNKLEQQGILDKDVCIIYHERFTTRIRKILGDIYTEDLPF